MLKIMAQQVDYNSEFSVPPPKVAHGSSFVVITVGIPKPSRQGRSADGDPLDIDETDYGSHQLPTSSTHASSTVLASLLAIKTARGTRDFAIHTNLLCSVSPFFRATFQGMFLESNTNKLALEEEEPDVFEVLYCWLYRLPVALPNHDPDAENLAEAVSNDILDGEMSSQNLQMGLSHNQLGYTNHLAQDSDLICKDPQTVAEFGRIRHQDHFWLQVFRMADRLIIPGLQLTAWEKITCLFPNNTYKRNVIPSQKFIKELFWDFQLGWLTNESEFEVFTGKRALQMWMTEHVNWAIYLKSERGPKAMQGSSKRDGLVDLLTRCRGFGQAVALTIVGHRMRNNKTNPHPVTQKDFAKRHGFDTDKLRTEALELANNPVTRSAKPHDFFSPLTFGFDQECSSRVPRFRVNEENEEWSTTTPRALKRMRL